MKSRTTRDREFNLAYLGLAVQRGLKPLGRWETYRDRGEEAFLQRLGLLPRLVTRRTRRSTSVTELIFSRDRTALDAYAADFGGTTIQHTPEQIRAEGLLFGYPSCCVEAFVTHGYQPNGLPAKDQALLFHWACPHCPVTPALVTAYRNIYRECGHRRDGLRFLGPSPNQARRRGFRMERAAAAILTSSLMAGTMAQGPAWAQSPAGNSLDHLLQIADDPDQDGLTNEEESYFGTDATRQDTHGAGSPDGYAIARRMAQQIEALPREEHHDRPYATDYLAKGAVMCSVCGTVVNMGGVLVTDPRSDLALLIPYLALHFMQQGSFAFQIMGHSASERMDPMMVDVVLNGHARSRIEDQGSNVLLSWYGVAGRQYRILSTPEWSSPWMPGPIFDGAGVRLEYIRPADEDHRFLTVESPPQD